MKATENKNYKRTLLACYLGFITQAITANFAPLLFLTFHNNYKISLGQIALIPTTFFVTQLIVDIFCAKFVDRIGYRKSIVASEAFSAIGLISLAFLPDLLPSPFLGILHFNWFGFQVDTGAEFASSHINFTFDTLFTPFSTDIFQTGVRLINHTNFYFLEFMEYDFLPGFFVNFIPSEKFSVSGCFLWQIKSATIYELQINEKSIINTCPAFELKFNYKFSEKFKSSVKISSFDLFTYHLFLSPFLNISGTYVINQSFSVKLEEQIIYVDYFTLSANLNEFSTRISVNWRL